MAFVTNKLVVVSQEKQPEQKKLVEMSLFKATTTSTTTRVEASKSNEISNIKEPSVVVNGKVKKIGKKSAFLLDMLSLDD